MMDDLDEEERNHLATNIAWLESAGPEDWHRVALDFNWSKPLYLLDWIVRQAECDVATALTIFWKGEPAYWLDKEGLSSERPNGFSYLNKKICAYIAGRVGAGGYTRSKIAYVPDTLMKKDYVDLAAEEKRLENPSFHAHPHLIRERRGHRVVNDAKFYSRYPEDFRHSFDYELPGDTPLSIAIMESVRQVEQAVLRLLPSWLRS